MSQNVSNKEQVLRSDKCSLVASSRKMNMKDVLQHPLGPLPWSLANCNGSMKKTNKAVLARKLESMAAPAEVIPQPSACIIDVMSFIQKMNGENLTYKWGEPHIPHIQITFIFIDFRVCDFAFAFSRFKLCFIFRQISICVLNANETFV